jgi:hypothetical protein
MEGYNSVFERSRNEFSKIENPIPIFESFRLNYPLDGFIHNGDKKPDEEAMSIAKQINESLCDTYMKRSSTKKLLGYGSYTPKFEMNELDSRHIMMSTHLFHSLPEPVNQIVEIGCGFGNWFWLNSTIQSFKKWTLIDLPHVGALQEWYLQNQNVSGYEIHSAFEPFQGEVDLVIGTHSLSELAWDIFLPYFENVVKKSKYLYYAYHNEYPALPLIQKKLSSIESEFDLLSSVPSEHGKVTNSLYQRKNT